MLWNLGQLDMRDKRQQDLRRIPNPFGLDFTLCCHSCR
jgi:hypothetical protein